MIITLITDQFYKNGNGTSVSAQNLYNGLTKKGHTVRVVSVDYGNHTPYALKERSFGMFGDKIIHSQDMQLAKPNKKVLDNAIDGADVVHILTPFKLGQEAIKECKKKNVPCTAAFHIVPENITSTLYLKNNTFVNKAIWFYWKGKLYKNINHIHCPSQMVANQLKHHHYQANLHIISNGFNQKYCFVEEEKPEIFKDKFIIAATGRFSREKRFDILIKAVNLCKHRDKILIIFGGKGPLYKKFMDMSKKLPVTPIFLGRYKQQQQLSFLSFSDLYVHTADIEVEGMTCLEACACGLVPVVSNSVKSATPQFTQHPNSLFKRGSAKDLAKKIDWWFEHPNELRAQKEKVANHAQNFRLENSIDLYENMFEAAIADFKNGVK